MISHPQNKRSVAYHPLLMLIMGIKNAALLAAILAGSLAPAADDSGVTYTITADEALHGPKPANPNYVIDAGAREASIAVDSGKVRGRVNPLVFGACFEDLNHEIYGGLYAQMIFGESFEEGPERELPPGWRFDADWLKRPTWQGMWCLRQRCLPAGLASW